jgi:hypothetical protein
MPLELEDVLSDVRWVTANYNGHEFEVAYRPAGTSLRRQSEWKRTLRQIQREGADSEIDESAEMAKLIVEMVAEWDLQRGGRPLPLTLDNVQDLPGGLFTAIMNAISGDAQSEPSEKKASSNRSAAGSRQTANSVNAQNGIPQSEPRNTWA